MARVGFGVSELPMRRKYTRRRYCFGATASLSFLVSTLFLAAISPALATVADYTSLTPDKSHSHLIAKDDTSSGFPFFLGSFNGLLIDDEGQETGETRGLDLVSRAPEGASLLENNHFHANDILMGEIQYFHFPKGSMGSNGANTTTDNQNNSASKRATTTVYLSLTICSKPILNESISDTRRDLPQLAVYVSISDSLQEPGPDKNNRGQTVHHSEEGYMNATMSTEGNIYIGVVAPNSGDYSGSYSYQIAASTDALFHAHEQTPMAVFVDSGSEAALFTMGGVLTAEQLQRWERNNTSVFTMFVNNANSTATAGLSRSYCALERYSESTMGDNIETSLSRTKPDDRPKEQFYITGLNGSSTYVGVLAMTGNSSDSGNGIVGGGGKIYRPQNFTTKADGNCAVIYDLDFCSDIAYAVPSNPSMNLSTLRSNYDNYTANLYKNFNYSLQQIQCNTSNETIFSMAVNCDDCATAYKNWLCAVTIPHCDDFSMTSNSTAVMVRNAAQQFPNGTKVTNKTLTENPMTNRPRNSGLIDDIIQPGPYMEILPRVQICHDLVRTCPMTLGFQCPRGKWLPYSYDTSAALSLRFPTASVVAAVSICGLFWLF
ncbi:stretch-activated Ca2+-permeable channel component-domain-containing protein [Aspergillus cavernicola]|uniref:Stretch-activated Ca2+-permeable channel component-domain-containing protein n=1 Tax=Aspergillus cavernicola TaxID=176166 RepID=A0ABR4I8C2_9EURO